MFKFNTVYRTATIALGLISLSAAIVSHAQMSAWPQNVPLGVTTNAKPMVMLVASKDHKLFYEAYNDLIDLNPTATVNDGIDIGFKPTITYYGLFEPNVCYTHNGRSDNDGVFSPRATNPYTSNSLPSGTCGGAWSGNWLNYMTTSRIDALRKVLYGGHRVRDAVGDTWLRRAYIPQDTHSWGKEYNGTNTGTKDVYNLSDYTAITGQNNNRVLFGNVTSIGSTTNCLNIDDCSNVAPWLSYVTGSSKRIWEWASKERPVLDDSHGGTRVNLTVQAKVCTSAVNSTCTKYPNGDFKPTGLLHDYTQLSGVRDSDQMLFGLLTGSYNKNMSGGVLRKVASSFSDEFDANTGQFIRDKSVIANSFDRLRIRDFRNKTSTDYDYRNPSYRSGPMLEGAYVDWGNPVAEMMYEGMRYFAGKKSATSDYMTSGSYDTQIGLATATWDDPYDAVNSKAKAPWCARSNMLVISDVYPSYDADKLPGSPYGSIASDITGLNLADVLNNIGNKEPGVKNSLRFIGQTTTSNSDNAPTPKTVVNLAEVRGLSPEEPAKQGSYFSAAVAHYGKITDLNPAQNNADPTLSGAGQTLDSFFLALTSPLPNIEVPAGSGGNQTIRIVPFAKTIDNGVNRAKGQYQPTNPIVDFYTLERYNLPGMTKVNGVNGGRPQMKFMVIYEADEQGNDFDMDVNSEYTISVNASGTVTVQVEVKYQSTGSNQNIGYVVSGTNRDGIYLVAQDKNENLDYFLNVPPGRSAGYCDPDVPGNAATSAACQKLPFLGATSSTTPNTAISTQEFSVGIAPAAQFLKDPLWYAAKWGGFRDRDGDKTPNLAEEWDNDNDGVPDTYFLVQNPLELKERLKRAFDNIAEAELFGNIVANSTTLTSETLVYQAKFSSARWSGDLEAYPVRSNGIDSNPNWRAAEKIPTPANRKIFYGNATSGGGAFTWSGLSNAIKTIFNDDPNAPSDNGEALLNYLRGVRTGELQNGGTLRNRFTALTHDNVLGDITHSSPTYVKNTDTVFIGANDGMLHAFDGRTGTELFAFIPHSVMPTSTEPGILSLADPEYNTNHRSFVDGDIAVATVPGSSAGSTNNYLVATLGRGGKGLFGLDVTNPSAFAAQDIEWNYSSSSDSDLGYMVGRPIITQNKNGTWIAIVGNGYNSSNQDAALYIFNLKTGALIQKIKTNSGPTWSVQSGNNGMSTPGIFDENEDGIVDYIYAGDLKGNLWKFTYNTSTNNWQVANSGSPMFTATDSSGARQPITAPVTVALNTDAAYGNENRRFVFFGTGKYLEASDILSTGVQTWYSVIDKEVVISTRAEMASRSGPVSSVFDGKAVRTFSVVSTADMSDKAGCFIDLPAAGERMVTASRLYRLSEPTLLATSIIPTNDDVCVPGGTGYLNAINPFTCGRLANTFFDVNNNGIFEEGEKSIGSIDLGVGMPGEAILIGNILGVPGTKGLGSVRVNAPSGAYRGRLSWREIIKD